MYDEWRNIGLKILGEDLVKEKFECPECGAKSVNHMYTTYRETDMGTLYIWCSQCMQGIQMCRVGVPDTINKVDMFDDELVDKMIPNFKLIHPVTLE